MLISHLVFQLNLPITQVEDLSKVCFEVIRKYVMLLIYFVAKRPDESSSSETEEDNQNSSRKPRPSGSSKGTKPVKSTKVTGHPTTRKSGITSMTISCIFFVYIIIIFSKTNATSTNKRPNRLWLSKRTM